MTKFYDFSTKIFNFLIKILKFLVPMSYPSWLSLPPRARMAGGGGANWHPLPIYDCKYYYIITSEALSRMISCSKKTKKTTFIFSTFLKKNPNCQSPSFDVKALMKNRKKFLLGNQNFFDR